MESQLFNEIIKLRQFSGESVQSGDGLDDLNRYLHVTREIEKEIIGEIVKINEQGGGIILLVGSAGDGKSHLISWLKNRDEIQGFVFYNDATSSCSPTKTATDTLKEALSSFNDVNIENTTKKMIIAINLGRLNLFFDDDEVKNNYDKLIKSYSKLTGVKHNDINNTWDKRVRFILFSDYQIFEVMKDKENEYPVDSAFLRTILDKIVLKDTINPFYRAYIEDKKNEKLNNKPIVLNYELLFIENIRISIVKYIIEAIIRFQLMVTPREFLDFISLVICPNYIKKYSERDDFFNCLLPNLFFAGGDNKILKALSKLDSLKISDSTHDNWLILMNRSHDIPSEVFHSDELDNLPKYLIERTRKFYANNGIDTEKTIYFLLRLKHLLDYHSESQSYKKYLENLCSISNRNVRKMKALYEMFELAIPRNNCSFVDQENWIPLNFQGGNYKMFIQIDMEAKEIESVIKNGFANKFKPEFIMAWQLGDGEDKCLPVNYKMFDYVDKLINGKLPLILSDSKDIVFTDFVNQLVRCSGKSNKIYVVSADDKKYCLSESWSGVKLSYEN